MKVIACLIQSNRVFSSLFNLTFFNTLDPTLKVVLHIIALIGALYGFVRVIVDLVGWSRRPRLKFYMSDDVWPVAEWNKSEFAINVQFVAYNPGRRMAVLRRLDAKLTRPSWTTTYPTKTFTLVWRRFINANPWGFEQTEAVLAKPVPPHESNVLGVQLRGHYDDKTDSFRSPSSFDWFPGKYILHLHARVNNRRIRVSPRSGFKFELNEVVSGQLSPADPFLDPFTRSVQLVS
jgi:hypothetical protein